MSRPITRSSGDARRAKASRPLVAPSAQPVAPTTSARSRPLLEQHRTVASVGLVLLMLLALFAPLATPAPNPAAFITPQVNGANYAITGATSKDLEMQIFPYYTVIERQMGNLQSAWPSPNDVLNYEPSSQETRQAIIGQIFAASSGSLDIRVRDSGLAANPTTEIFESLFGIYQGNDDPNRVANGLAMLRLLSSITSPTLEARYARERDAVLGFQRAATQGGGTWQYTYNWGLASLLTGNYLSAYEAMRNIVNRPETADFHLVKFWMGLAALRMGDPDEGIRLFNEIINVQLPAGANEGLIASFNEARILAREALGDAQWARRDPVAAYNTYLSTLQDRPSYTLYRKWLRIGLEQHAYERMLSDMSALGASGYAPELEMRIQHDRARLLDFLGRTAEADGEYASVLSGAGQNDAAFLVSYAQSRLARGDYSGALARAEAALTQMSRDLSAGDMVGVASTVPSTTVPLQQRYNAQLTLDAHLVRSMAWSRQNRPDLVDSLVSNMIGNAPNESASIAGLLYLYGGYAYESAAVSAPNNAAAQAYYIKAADTYAQAWSQLNELGPGQPGRAASLAGQARTIPLADGRTIANGIDVLKAGGYDPVSISPAVTNDADAGELLYAGAALLESNGQAAEAANAYRVAGVLINVRDAQGFSGVGRPFWMNNGTPAPAAIALRTGDALRRAPGADLSQVVYRYKQSYGLSPALAPAWNNLGVLYADMGNPASQAYLELASKANPSYALGNHNLAAAAYKAGFGNFFTAEAAQGAAIKTSGAESLRWGYNLRYDERSLLPAPSGPPADFWVRIGALVILALLLLHTLVGNDRTTNRMGLVPTKGLIGKAAAVVDARLRALFPALTSPGTDTRSALVTSIVVPAVVGMIALAWSAGHGSWEVALVFLPAAFLLALVSFGANELAQRWAAGRANAGTLHHVWPAGVLLGILSIPFGFMYGWQNITRLTTGKAQADAAGARRMRTAEESDVLYESQLEAAADTGATSTVETVPATAAAAAGSGFFNLSPAARIIFAGVAANLLLALVFAVIYWLTGWPTMRLGLFATSLVLAFTSVSEPPADGWTLYRRNAPLWLAVFLLSATVATLLAIGII